MEKNNLSISEKIYHISNLQQEYISERFKKLHLNSQQSRCINFIHEHPGAIQKDIAKYIGKSDATVTNILKPLEKKELIIRETKKDNERQKNLYLTESGNKLAVEIGEIFEGMITLIEKDFSKNELKALSSFLDRIEKSF
ncbi:hypothetical protein BG261_05730 [Floricoccus tropicus]|uniref:HTH marR-type domain-containing protein n=1 Tax=Floricoccus tropicus TaxID=1859473 RepID=A0A1E8GKV2_9LACT|nr:MarR family transcriptional regulator [Floricoccus tropicus]OFI48884.1 hypothetical protein BG261_05730 [Floricoccus tropicus]